MTQIKTHGQNHGFINPYFTNLTRSERSSNSSNEYEYLIADSRRYKYDTYYLILVIISCIMFLPIGLVQAYHFYKAKKSFLKNNIRDGTNSLRISKYVFIFNLFFSTIFYYLLFVTMELKS